MTYMFDIWRLRFCRRLILARAAAKASSRNGFGCAWICAAIASACARVGELRDGLPRGAAGCARPRAGATPWALGVIAA